MQFIRTSVTSLLFVTYALTNHNTRICTGIRTVICKDLARNHRFRTLIRIQKFRTAVLKRQNLQYGRETGQKLKIDRIKLSITVQRVTDPAARTLSDNSRNVCTCDMEGSVVEPRLTGVTFDKNGALLQINLGIILKQ